MKEFTKTIIIVSLLLLLIGGFVWHKVKMDYMWVVVDYNQWETEAMRDNFNECEGQRREDVKFRDERCVCVRWTSSSNEPPMTKDEICNYSLKMYEYSNELGYSSIEYWEAEPSY